MHCNYKVNSLIKTNITKNTEEHVKFEIMFLILDRFMKRANKTNPTFKDKLINQDITMKIKFHDKLN